MFTPVILACVAGTCFGLAGSAYTTEEACIADLQTNGIAYVQQTLPGAQIVAARCIDWGQGA